ncbi:IS21 family transposase [Deinococcus detaillensis]|uniref:IS21 family transposase n=1 Tax=Deinococcus detaillensis TaxID=2592048 RepID=A0A553UZ33_9DEIO|nr:IS21 family transposase [Deinococcus detaillensis]TSA85475.1 IS21 family transposase [Deinococcus detaillensis]
MELGLSDRLIGQSVGLARSTVQDYVIRAQQVNVIWPLPPELDDVQLEDLLFCRRDQSVTRLAHEPDWLQIDQELRRKGVTRQLLWEEYRQKHPDGWQYATFNDNYRKWKGTQGLTMRQTHRAGEKLFVDYAGLTLPLTHPGTGIIHPAQVFVATLGASNYTYAEVTRTQNSDDWISSHIRALASFGGVPEVIVPDNLKAGVTHASRYEPELNRSYQEFAQHYDVAVIPTRVRKPRDKALVEVHVQIVERRILAPLRNRAFFSVPEANEAIWDLLHDLNRPAAAAPVCGPRVVDRRLGEGQQSDVHLGGRQSGHGRHGLPEKPWPRMAGSPPPRRARRLRLVHSACGDAQCRRLLVPGGLFRRFSQHQFSAGRGGRFRFAVVHPGHLAGARLPLLALLTIGTMQQQLLHGDAPWVVEVPHLLLGLGVVVLTELAALWGGCLDAQTGSSAAPSLRIVTVRLFRSTCQPHRQAYGNHPESRMTTFADVTLPAAVPSGHLAQQVNLRLLSGPSASGDAGEFPAHSGSGNGLVSPPPDIALRWVALDSPLSLNGFGRHPEGVPHARS